MGIIEEQLCVMLGCHVNLVWDFAECVFDESFLQLRLLAMRPGSENSFGNRDLFTARINSFDFVSDCLS